MSEDEFLTAEIVCIEEATFHLSGNVNGLNPRRMNIG
jgi:hypothetical protein